MKQHLLEIIRCGGRMPRGRYVTSAVILSVALAVTISAIASGAIMPAAQIHPVGYSDAGRLVQLWERNEKEGFDLFSVSAPNFLDWKEQNQVFDQMAAYREQRLIFKNRNNREEQVLGVQVTTNLFDMLGIAPASGRTLKAGDRLNSRVIVLSDRLWQRRFDSDPAVVGQRLSLNGVNYTVVGIMPPDFTFPLQVDLPGDVRRTMRSSQADLWLPFNSDDLSKTRGSRLLRVVARLRSGVTLDQAEADINAIARSLESRYPATNAGWSVVAKPLGAASR